MSISTAHTNLIDGLPMQRVCFRVLEGSEDIIYPWVVISLKMIVSMKNKMTASASDSSDV